MSERALHTGSAAMTHLPAHRSAAPAVSRGRLCRAFTALGALSLLGACGVVGPLLNLDQAALPADIRVPAGHVVVLQAQGRGELLYECQAIRRTPYEYTWLLRNPSLQLQDGRGNLITYYPGTRSRWVHSDGSEVVAREFVEIPSETSLPLLRAKADPTEGRGALEDVSYVQNLHNQGGVVSGKPCTAAALGMRTSVPYQADYVFWRPASRG